MEGKISKEGILFIKRGSLFKKQRCNINVYCGDLCPLFGEPHIMRDRNRQSLQICDNRVLFFKKLIDERE